MKFSCNFKACYLQPGCITVFTVLLLGISTARADSGTDGHWLFYPSIHADLRSDLDPESDEDASDAGVKAALLYEKTFNRFHFIGEALASDEDSDIERFQIGWTVTDDMKLWLGRFHNPIGYWNYEYGHGAQTQISVHRPNIIEYEVDGGVLPTHISGALLESNKSYGDVGVNYIFAVGQGPELTDKAKLEPLSLVNPSDTENDLSMTVNLAFTIEQPFVLKSGLFMNRSKLPSKLGVIKEVEQSVFGGFFHGEWSRWAVTWAMYSVSNSLKDKVMETQSSFGGGYGQFNYQLDRYWTGFVRIEDFEDVGSDDFLRLFPDYIADRNLIGMRLNFRKNQSLTFEILDSTLVNGNHVHTSVQGSALIVY
jgi:hypothetical protein